jgi:hypothetical protein
MERRGRPVNQPQIGDPVVPLVRGHILGANRLMFLATVIAAAAFTALRWGAVTILGGPY